MTSSKESSNSGMSGTTPPTSRKQRAGRKRSLPAASGSAKKSGGKLGPMSPIEFRKIWKRHLDMLRQSDVAELLDVAPRSLRRWIAGDARVFGPAKILLRLLDRRIVSLNDIRDAG